MEKAENFETTLHEMIRKTIKDHKRIIFNGNGYDDAWIKEATEKRGLCNYRTTADCIPHILDKKNVDMLTAHKVFTEAELRSRMEITLENYCKTVIIEANTMVSMARSEITPAVEAYVKEIAETAMLKKSVSDEISCTYESKLLKKLSVLTERISFATDELENAIAQVGQTDNIIAEAAAIRDILINRMGELRVACDEAEVLTSKKYWPFPTYSDLLFGVR